MTQKYRILYCTDTVSQYKISTARERTYSADSVIRNIETPGAQLITIYDFCALEAAVAERASSGLRAQQLALMGHWRDTVNTRSATRTAVPILFSIFFYI